MKYSRSFFFYRRIFYAITAFVKSERVFKCILWKKNIYIYIYYAPMDKFLSVFKTSKFSFCATLFLWSFRQFIIFRFMCLFSYTFFFLIRGNEGRLIFLAPFFLLLFSFLSSKKIADRFKQVFLHCFLRCYSL